MWDIGLTVVVMKELKCPLFVIWKLFIRIRLIYFSPLVDLSPAIQEGNRFGNSSSEAIKVKSREIDGSQSRTLRETKSR